MDRRGFLKSSHQPKPLHWPFASSERLVRVFRPIVEPAPLLARSVADRPQSPSGNYGCVILLHLAHSRDYWLDFCDKVLQRQLHHDPAEGGTSDDAQFTFNYKRTLTLYQTIFGKAPPPAIWPPAPIRFAYGADRRKVSFALFSLAPNRAAYIIIGVMAAMMSGVTIPFIPQWDAEASCVGMRRNVRHRLRPVAAHRRNRRQCAEVLDIPRQTRSTEPSTAIT